MTNIFSSSAFRLSSQVAATLTATLPGAVLAASTAAPVGTDGTCDPVSNPNPISGGEQCATSKSNVDSLFGSSGIFHTIADVLIFLIGAVAVIMLIFGGFQYVISSGDKGRVESAKQTILYAIIGIVVAILAYAIVGFVTGSLAPTSTATTP